MCRISKYIKRTTCENMEELKTYLVKKKVENDPDDTVYHFDNVEEAMKFLDYATR